MSSQLPPQQKPTSSLHGASLPLRRLKQRHRPPLRVRLQSASPQHSRNSSSNKCCGVVIKEKRWNHCSDLLRHQSGPQTTRKDKHKLLWLQRRDGPLPERDRRSYSVDWRHSRSSWRQGKRRVQLQRVKSSG